MLIFFLYLQNTEKFLQFLYYNSFFYFVLLNLFTLLFMVFAKNPINTMLYFILFFILNFSVIIYCGLDFIALLFLLIYAGAIAVLFIFLIMLLDIRFILSYTSKYNFLFYSVILFFISLFSTMFILKEPVYSNVNIFYQDWLSIFYFKSNIKNVGFMLTNVYYPHIFLVGLLLTLVLIILISFILADRYTNTSYNFLQVERIKYKRLLLI